jgi:predicted nucleic-acid-binding protein
VIAIDTNILVHLLTGDDIDQVNRVDDLLSSNTAWVSRTVCLELAWVLKSRYKLPQSEIAQAIQKLLQGENLQFEDETELEAAMELAMDGFDIADAIHLCCSPSHTLPFVSFDNDLIRKANLLGFHVESPNFN